MEPAVAVCFAVWLLAMFVDVVICLRFLILGRKKEDGSRRILGQGEKKILLCALLHMVMLGRFVVVNQIVFDHYDYAAGSTVSAYTVYMYYMALVLSLLWTPQMIGVFLGAFTLFLNRSWERAQGRAAGSVRWDSRVVTATASAFFVLVAASWILFLRDRFSAAQFYTLIWGEKTVGLLVAVLSIRGPRTEDDSAFSEEGGHAGKVDAGKVLAGALVLAVIAMNAALGYYVVCYKWEKTGSGHSELIKRYGNVEKEDNWLVYIRGRQYYYTVFDNDKNEMAQGGPYSEQPEIGYTDGGLVRICVREGSGTGNPTGYYCNVRTGEVSKSFPEWMDDRDGRVVYCSRRAVIVEDIFDPGQFRRTFSGFSKPFSKTVSPFVSVSFIDEGRGIRVKYLSGANYEAVTEEFAID